MNKTYINPKSRSHALATRASLMAASGITIGDNEVEEQGGKQNPFWEDAEEGDDAWHNGASR